MSSTGGDSGNSINSGGVSVSGRHCIIADVKLPPPPAPYRSGGERDLGGPSLNQHRHLWFFWATCSALGSLELYLGFYSTFSSSFLHLRFYGLSLTFSCFIVGHLRFLVISDILSKTFKRRDTRDRKNYRLVINQLLGRWTRARGVTRHPDSCLFVRHFGWKKRDVKYIFIFYKRPDRMC